MRRAAVAALALALFAGPVRADRVVGVVVAVARLLDFPLTVEGLGTARANEAIEVRAQLTATITSIHFEEGQRVSERDVLVKLENSQPLSAVAAAKAELIDSEGQYRRAQELYKTRTLSASEVEQRAARRDADRAALKAARGRLSDTVIRAPFDGRVGIRRVSPGSLATPDTIITTLDDTDTIKLDFAVPETALGRLEEGLPVIARSAAWPDEVFEGRVAVVDTRVDPISRTILVRARIDNSNQRLRPGMFLTVELLRTDVTALMIPEQSIIPEQSRQYVLVVGTDGLVEKREVRTGRRRPGQVEILAGVNAGETIVAEGTQKARPGAHVEIVREIDLAPAPSDQDAVVIREGSAP